MARERTKVLNKIKAKIKKNLSVYVTNLFFCLFPRFIEEAKGTAHTAKSFELNIYI